MRITIDASSTMPPRTGVGNYTWHVVRELLRLDHLNEYTLFFNSLRRPLPEGMGGGLDGRVTLCRRRFPGPWLHRAWKRWGRPSMERLAGPADLVHAAASIVPPVREARRVVTLYDCYFMRRPDHCHDLGGLYMRETLPALLPRCDAVICISHFTRREALEFFDLDPGRVHVARPGVDRDFFRAVTDAD
ncbi:glycosyltransferase, partial [bacterium]|nr:glycosyltransferase [bacterium]